MLFASPMLKQRPHRSEQRERHGQNHRRRRDPAFVLPGEREIDQQDGERKNEIGGTAHEFFLIRQRRPLEVHAGGQRFTRDGFHRLERLAGTEAGGGRAVDRGGGKQIVERDDGWPVEGLISASAPMGTMLPP